MNLQGKRILVIGLGESGLAMARWLSRQGAIVRVADSRENPPNEAKLRALVPAAELVAGAFDTSSFDGIELIAISPGVPVQTPLIQEAIARGVHVVSEIEIFAWGIRQMIPQAKIIAITGSNGKTTTTALTSYLLNAAGTPAIACGNISPSALDALMDVQDARTGGVRTPAVWVLELSSFQLETTYSLNADAATVLNISEDHLDHYASMSDYVAAKERVFQGSGVIVLHRDDTFRTNCQKETRKNVSFGLSPAARSSDFGLDNGWIVRGNDRLIELDSLKIVGMHNAANAMAALALCEAICMPMATIVQGLRSFAGLPHRVEFVSKINGVSCYDDSKGTNVGASLAAIQGLGCKVAIILGGEGKGQDFSPLKSVLTQHACAVALIGRDAELIKAAIAGCGVPVQLCGDLREAVRWCAAQTQSGDALLLSPACASFDMFRNYAHRAEVFVNAVRDLERETA